MSVYLLPVWDTISAAWAKVLGSKKTFWASLGIFFVIMFGFGVLEGITEGSAAISGLIKIIANVFAYFLQIGLIYMGIRRAKDMPINFKMLFYTIDVEVALKLIGLYIVQMVLFIIPAVIGGLSVALFAVGGAAAFLGALLAIAAFIAIIVIAVRISIAIGFLLDQGLGPWVSVKKSFEATTGNFWNLLGLYLIQLIIMIVSIIPLGIGLIWSLPFALICFGVAYDRLSTNAQ